MESKGISLGHIRALLILQQGRCAISGVPLEPSDVNGDHIIPISRKDISPPSNKHNLWLVSKRVNAMKGTMTYDELVEMAKLIISNEATARRLLERVVSGEVGEETKQEFDSWVNKHCDSEGKVIG